MNFHSSELYLSCPYTKTCKDQDAELPLPKNSIESMDFIEAFKNVNSDPNTCFKFKDSCRQVYAAILDITDNKTEGKVILS